MTKLICQECKGYGYVTEDYILGHALHNSCDFCAGSGEVTPKMRGVWLTMKREEAKAKRGKQ